MDRSWQNMLFSCPVIGIFAFFILIGSVVPINVSTSITVSNFDKILHFSIYAIFAVLIFGTLKIKFNAGITKIVLFTLISAGVYGILIELVQKAIPYREAEILDVYCNLFGTILGIIISKVVKW